MTRKLRLALFTHSLTSDWNNGNAHFLRGLARALVQLGHNVTCWEQRNSWSRTGLISNEDHGEESLRSFHSLYPDLNIKFHSGTGERLSSALADVDIAIVHEWHTPQFIEGLLAASRRFSCRLIFHDTHHRASSSPGELRKLQIEHFDGVLAFGEALRKIYIDQFNIERVWTLHEAADTTIFYPKPAQKDIDVVWIGNWGDGERTEELQKFLIHPARQVAEARWLVHGVRYPEEGLRSLEAAGVRFGGYLPNLEAAAIYRRSKTTLHIPRQQYQGAMQGIPTIRVFEALAVGTPLVSAPWNDTEELFRPGDYLKAKDDAEMTEMIRMLLDHPDLALAQAQRGLETVLSHHTCKHRAEKLELICEDILS